jgi:hypothetical protein
VGSFDTLQLVDDLRIPTGSHMTSGIPEPITSTYPEWGTGGATQAITNKAIIVDAVTKLVEGGTH